MIHLASINVGSLLHAHGQELNLVLFVHQSVLLEVAHLRVAVFNLSACLRNVLHALLAEEVGLGIGSRLMIAVLVDGGIEFLVLGNHVVFQFAHGLELHACHLGEGARCLGECVLRRTGQQIAVFIEIRAEHAERGNLGKGVYESGAVARQHIEVAAACLDKREEAAAVDALTACEDGVEIGHVGDDEVECFQFSVATGIHEIHHFDFIFLDVADDVCLCK